MILHPFSDVQGPERLTLTARTGLILHGLIPAGQSGADELWNHLLEGRYREVKMLYYLGKDLSRWLGQCMEVVARDEELRDWGITPDSFITLLVEDTPPSVREKMERWGVVDYRAIIRRAMGLHIIFAAVPVRDTLSDEFLRRHHRIADCLYECRVDSLRLTRLSHEDFEFEVYASGEYARLLESQWEGC